MDEDESIEYLKRKGKVGTNFSKIQDSLSKLRYGYDYLDFLLNSSFNNKDFYDSVVRTNIIPPYVKDITPRLYITENAKLLEELLETSKEDQSIFDRNLIFGNNFLEGEYYIAILRYDGEREEGETYLLWRDLKQSGFSKISTWNKEAKETYQQFLNNELKKIFKTEELDMFG